MTVAVLDQLELQPVSWPVIGGLSDAASSIAQGPVWVRIESWIAWRWPSRSVVWIVEGRGQFVPRLRPFTLATLERWTDSAWATVEAVPGPLGYCLDCAGPYRLTGTAGDDSETPAAVLEAARRLAEYFASIEGDTAGTGGFTSETLGDYSRSGRPSAWAARAMALSGAADLLRPWRGLR